MALVLTVAAGYLVDNTQKAIKISGRMTITGSGSYPAGGLALDSVILALPEATTNSGVRRCVMTSDVGSGYIWTRITSTGKAMALQVPPSGSLTTAAPLQQLPSSVTEVTLNNEAINFEATLLRNA
jgi:hypothetical protein